MKKINKTTRSNLITYAMILVMFLVMQTLVSTGNVPSLLQGLLVPLCAYIILAVSLNQAWVMQGLCVSVRFPAHFSQNAWQT